jgi:hypothetical protein
MHMALLLFFYIMQIIILEKYFLSIRSPKFGMQILNTTFPRYANLWF